MTDIDQNNLLKAHEQKLSRILFAKNHLSDALQESHPKTGQNADRKPAWQDDDDENVTLCKKNSNNGNYIEKYSDILKRKFNALIGTPDWAQLDRKIRHDSADDDSIETVGHLFKRPRAGLKRGTIEIKRFPKLNAETGTEGPQIKSVEFHPTSSVGMVAGFSGVVSLFAVDGLNNSKLHSVALQKFKIHTARFTKIGSEAFLGSTFSYFYVYDLMKAEALKVCLPKSVVATTKRFEMSKCGKYVAVAGRFGEIHLMCAKSRELLRTFKQSDLATALSFDNEGKYLFGHSETGFVTVWNINQMRAEFKWADDGCISGSSLALSQCGEYFATGSAEGVANIYNYKDIFTRDNPKPLHSVTNLTTKIDNIRFNSSSEILGISSSLLANSIKLIHIPSFHVFSNFPGAQSNFKQINCFEFSPNSGYLGIGNDKNSAYLHRLKHYSNY